MSEIWESERPDGRLRLYWWWAELIDDDLRPNPAEVAELRWCTPDEIRRLPNVLPNNLEFLQAIADGHIPFGTEPHE